MADEAKAKGNAAFSAGRFEEAIGHFTDAVNLDPSNHVLYSNRSAAQASLKRFGPALEDAQKTVELKPDWAKGYSRLGAAHFGLRSFDESIEAYKKGVELDPANEQIKAGLSEVENAKEAKESGGGGMGGLGNMFSSPDIWAKLAQNPETRGYLAQPDFVQMLNAVQANPSALGTYMSDPRMMKVLGMMIGVNVSSGDEFMKEQGGKPESPAAPTPKEPEPEPEPMMTDEEQAEKKAKEDAIKEKELGNAAYKKKEFETAIEHYNKAIELNDSDISFLTNRAAVYMEMGNFDDCIKDCDTAFEKGRELRIDFKLVARALSRKGTALTKKGELKDAIEVFNRSLMEHRNADTLKKLKDAESAYKKQQEEAYLNPELADEEKNKGNELFRDGKFADAVKHYSEAIKRNPKDHKVYSNRAACYMKLAAFNEALKDANQCIAIDPTFPKGYTRKGAVQFFMKEYDKAMETYQEGLKHDANNEELTDGIKRCVDMINKGNRGELSEEEMKMRQQKAMQDPEIQMILQDPIMRQVLNDFQTDPKAAQVSTSASLSQPRLLWLSQLRLLWR
ncbi:DNA binding protein, partial [Cymbomonas tetramitiformis]